METKKTTENINEAKRFFFEKRNKIDKPSATFIKKKERERERAQMNKSDIKQKLQLIPKKYKGL